MDHELIAAIKKRASIRKPNAHQSIDEKLDAKQKSIVQATPEQAKQEKACDQN